MKRLAVVALVVASAVVASGFGSPPPPGSVKGLAEVLALAPQSVRDVYADAGFDFTEAGPYVMFNVRAWYDPSTGDVGFPRMPEGITIVRVRRAGPGCAVSGLCVNDTDGGLDPVSEVTLDCACSSGSACVIANPDGGVFPDGGPRPVAAPLGMTLDAFKGTGCVRKSCVEVAGGTSSWPAACPCPSGGC